MNVINAFEMVNTAGHNATLPPAPLAQPVASAVFTLRRSGARPISFAGRHLGYTNGYRVGTALWHELNLYQTEDGRYVADIRVFYKAEGSKDQFHVLVAETLDEALTFLESYDPRLDVSADFEVDDASLAPAELLVQAASLKYRIAETVTQYRAVLAAFLNDLHNG